MPLFEKRLQISILFQVESVILLNRSKHLKELMMHSACIDLSKDAEPSTRDPMLVFKRLLADKNLSGEGGEGEGTPRVDQEA